MRIIKAICKFFGIKILADVESPKDVPNIVDIGADLFEQDCEPRESIVGSYEDLRGLLDTIDAVYTEELHRPHGADNSGASVLLQKALVDGWTATDMRRWVRNNPEWNRKHPGLELPDDEHMPRHDHGMNNDLPWPRAEVVTPVEPDVNVGLPKEPAAAGLLRPFGKRGAADDAGPRLVLHCSDFSLLRLWHNARADSQPDALEAVKQRILTHQRYNYTGARVLMQVMTADWGVWEDLEIDTAWPSYDEDVRSLYAYCQSIGFRLQVTLIGAGTSTDADQRPHMLHRPVDRMRHIERHAELVKGYEDVMSYVDMVNEAYAVLQGFEVQPYGRELLELEARYRELTGGQIMTGTSATWLDAENAMSDYHQWGGVVKIAHLDRDTGGDDGHSRPNRQPYHFGQEGVRWADQEPIGYGSSVESVSHGHHIMSGRTSAWIAGTAMSTCYHSHDGVYGGDLTDDAGYKIAARARFMVPRDVANGHLRNTHENYGGREWTVTSDQLTRNDDTGLARFYTSTTPTHVTGVVVGQMSAFPATAERDYKLVQVVNQRLLAVVQEWADVKAGTTVTIEKQMIDDDPHDPHDQRDALVVVCTL